MMEGGGGIRKSKVKKERRERWRIGEGVILSYETVLKLSKRF
jgi:hypothetical protein